MTSAALRKVWSSRSHEFAGALLDPDVVIPDGIGAKDSDAPAPKRFSVYRNNVVVSLMEALAATYPSTKALLGDENFDRISRAYVARHPPKSAMMQTYGDTFATFVEALPVLSDLPFLSDLARVEWAWNEALHAQDDVPLDGGDLAEISPGETMALTLHPASATTLIRSKWCVHTLFQCRFEELPEDLDFDVPQNALVVRHELDVAVIDLPDADAACLEALLNERSFGEAVGSGMAVEEGYNPAPLIALCLQNSIFKSNSI